MTTTEAAALLNTALRNVQNYCKRHNLPKRGRDYDIAAADIEGIRAELGRVGRPKSEHSKGADNRLSLSAGVFVSPAQARN